MIFLKSIDNPPQVNVNELATLGPQVNANKLATSVYRGPTFEFKGFYI